jgi:demethylmenaquinone methyltransferase/2-methoxy-6-polyprenyl-1,4-benzoquinol methylase
VSQAEAPGRLAPDGSPYPERGRADFERDVRRMFAHIAPHYERFNHLATFGQDVVWRARALWELDRFRTGPVRDALDVGSGTGELAHAVARHFPDARVVVTDFTGEMVRAAQERLAGRADVPRADFGRASALALPFADGSFDLVTNAFLLRNLSSLPAGLLEMRRVLRPGGVLLSLEVGEPASAMVRSVFHAHFDRVVPLLGRAFASEGPYRYLPESLKLLPDRSAMLSLHRAAGFARVAVQLQSFGIVATYLAAAPSAPGQSR